MSKKNDKKFQPLKMKSTCHLDTLGTNGAASHPRRTETSSTLLQKAEILHSTSVSIALKYFIFFIEVLLPCFSSVSHGFYLIAMSVCHFLQSLSLNIL
jgi:hypothetical protein